MPGAQASGAQQDDAAPGIDRPETVLAVVVAGALRAVDSVDSEAAILDVDAAAPADVGAAAGS